MNALKDKKPQKIGRYLILEYVGSGSMGSVYKARDPDFSRTVAIKTIRFDLLSPQLEHTRFLTRFYHEARISGTLSHPNIVSLYDMGETKNKMPFLAMEYAEGKMLGELLTQDGSFCTLDILDILSQVAAGLEYAHDKGVIHRDIKPSNIIVDDEGRVKITDFGIAKLMDAQVTQTEGSQLGTPRYMSPEQIIGKNLDARSDIFSLGVVAFEMLSGERPFPGPHIAAVLYKIVQRDPIRPSSLERLGFVPEKWNEVFSKVLAKEPSQRFTRAGDFVRALFAMCPDSDDVVSAPRKPRTIEPLPAISAEVSNDSAEDETLTLAPRLALRPFRPRWIPGAAALALTVGFVSLALLRNKIPGPPQPIMESARMTPGDRSPWLPSMPVNPPEVATGSIFIRTDPPGAAVLLNGRERGVTPLKLEKLAFGAHSIIIEMETYRTVELTVLLSNEGAQTAFDIPLRPDGSPEATEARTSADAPNQDTVPPELGQSPQSVWLAAEIRQEGRQLLLRNENNFDWLNVKLELADPRIAFKVARIQAGHTYTIINPSALMPKLITIWCDTSAGKGFYSTKVSP